jgi:hypothetical protein
LLERRPLSGERVELDGYKMTDAAFLHEGMFDIGDDGGSEGVGDTVLV